MGAESAGAYRVTYYRYEERRWSQGEGFRPRLEVALVEFDVVKRTPRGVWVVYRGMTIGRRFVLDGARRRYACPTKEEAMESFVARKRKQAKIYETRLGDTRAVLAMVGGL
jgi:hypothetical protein